MALAPGLWLLLLATVALMGIRPIADGDVWWHLKTGEYFFQHRTFPDHDPFMFTAGGDHWIIRAWLTEVIFYLVFRLGGPAGLILFKAALFTLAVGTLWRLGAAVRCPAPAAALLLLLAALTAWPRLAERPETFSFLLLSAALAILVRDGGRRAYLLLPLQALWANIHSSFFVGLLLPWPFVIDAAARHLRSGDLKDGEERHPPVRHLLTAAVLLWPASAITPEGIGALLYPIHLARMHTLGIVEEVQPLVTALKVCLACLAEGIAFLVLGLATVAVCLLQVRAGHGVGPGTWALLAGTTAVPFFVYRLLPYAGLILAVIVMRGLGRLSSEQTHSREARPPLRRQTLLGAAALLLLLITAAHVVRGSRAPFMLGVARDIFPEGAARFVLTAGARGPMFNSLDFGSYLLWSLFPRHQVFIHPDVWSSVSSDRFIARFFQSGRDPATFDELVRDYRIELLVLPNSPGAWSFVAADPGWALIYWDQVASVYARREGANAALIASHEFRFTRYAADLSYLLEVAQDPGRYMGAAAELRRAVREDPQNMAAGLSLAFLLKARGQDLEEALEAVRAAERRGLRDATLFTWKAEILAGLGRTGEAEAAVREAIRVDPRARTARLVLAGLRARAGDREGAARQLRELLARPDLSSDLRREAESRLRALTPAP